MSQFLARRFAGRVATRIASACAVVTIALVAVARPAAAQAITVDVGPRTESFDYIGATPISPTSVIQVYFTKADSGATLAYALVIRGPAGWYNAKSSWTSLPADSLPPGGYGELWQVGARKYSVRYDASRATLATFDTTVDLTTSRVVLVTLGDTPDAKAIVQSAAPLTMSITRAVEQPIVELLRRAKDVRDFATPPR